MVGRVGRGGMEVVGGVGVGWEDCGRGEMMVIDCCLMPPPCIILCPLPEVQQLPIPVLLSGIAWVGSHALWLGAGLG